MATAAPAHLSPGLHCQMGLRDVASPLRIDLSRLLLGRFHGLSGRAICRTRPSHGAESRNAQCGFGYIAIENSRISAARRRFVGPLRSRRCSRAWPRSGRCIELPLRLPAATQGRG